MEEKSSMNQWTIQWMIDKKTEKQVDDNNVNCKSKK